MSLGGLKGAQRAVRTSAFIRKKRLSPDKFFVSRSYRTYAEVLFELGKYRQALYYIEKATKIVRAYHWKHPELLKYNDFLIKVR